MEYGCQKNHFCFSKDNRKSLSLLGSSLGDCVPEEAILGTNKRKKKGVGTFC